ncbi:glutamyl-tRNA reductase [Desulfovibrio sp. OttesenSCG-928-F07]|nr:glutamyl-tRNA reductase [Desulfovibrio sp. OttesenSCG-928-F07]
MNKDIYLIGLNHRTAGVEVRESFALTGVGLLENGLLPVATATEPDAPIKEAMVLSTCNRVEILAVGNGDDLKEQVIRHWAEAKGKNAEDLTPFVYAHKGEDAIKHLFTVASSLDSMVLGEPQILGQLKDAYKKALDLGATKTILNRLLHRAFYVAKRVRNETGVASSAVSISYAAVELAKRIFGDMSQYRAMLIGAGEMAELAATHLMNAGIKSVWVANRTHERAIELAAQYNGLAVPFENLFEQLHEVDIVISSTGAPDAVIRARDMAGVMKKRKNRPMFFIDIAVPRDIDPDVNGLDNIYLYDIDDLKEVVEENLAQRRDEAVKAHGIVAEETVEFLRWIDSLSLQPTIVDLIRRSETIVQEEWQRTIKRLDLNEETEAALQVMFTSMVKKLNHEPISFLKRRFYEEAGTKYISIVRRMFNLDNEDVSPDAHADRKHL